MTGARQFVIVGAGPAGMRAAERLVAAGVRPVVVDEAHRHGGQVYRQPPTAWARSRADLYGEDATRASSILDRFEALRPHIDYRPDTLAWHHEPRVLQLLSHGRDATLPYDALILATGATDRVLPFPGWTLPGVYTLGAAQVALKFQGCLVGPRVVFAGTGPLLYLVASQYLGHGGQVAAVLDTAPWTDKLRALHGLAARPAMALRGARYAARLRLAGVPIHLGVTVLRASGDSRVETLQWRHRGVTRTTPCDAIGFGHGLRAETQLADLAGCAFAHDPVDEAWLPTRDGAGRSSVPGVYLAGDGAAILGAHAAELSGARAALAALEDCQQVVPAGAAELERDMRPHRAFRSALATAFALPRQWAAEAADDLTVCRCEAVSAAAVRACVRDTGTRDINRLKALTRVGMGRCQGRMCEAAAARLLAQAAGCQVRDVGRLRAQPPVKPLPVHLMRASMPARAALVDERDD